MKFDTVVTGRSSLLIVKHYRNQLTFAKLINVSLLPFYGPRCSITAILLIIVDYCLHMQ